MSNIYTNSYFFLFSLMMNPKNLRNLNPIDFKVIQTYLTHISPKISSYLESKRSLLYKISSQDTKNLVYLISDSLQENLNRFETNLKITSAGTYLGFIEKGRFFLSLEGAEYFLSENLVPTQILTEVNKEGEKSILYGNPIQKKMIYNIDRSVKKNSVILILNQSSELIALGHLEVDLSEFNEKDEKEIIVKNLVDKGYYLRRKQ